MKTKWLAVAIAAAFGMHTAANATVITVLAPGITSIAAPTETFDDRPLGTAIFSPGGDGGSYLGIGNVTSGTTPGVTAAPFYGPNPGDRDPTQYLSIGPGNDPETITYAGLKTFFGLYWGSVDAYNTVDFYQGASLVASFTGADIIPLLANGNQDDFSSNRYVVFSDLSFDKVVLGSSGPCPEASCNFPNSTPAFEIDNIATGVPEPATWALMLLGFASVGFFAYRRTKKGELAVS